MSVDRERSPDFGFSVVFVHHHRYFLSSVGPTIKVTTISTGKDIRILSEHSDGVTGLLAVTEDHYQV
jgi:hypothetical protein